MTSFDLDALRDFATHLRSTADETMPVMKKYAARELEPDTVLDDVGLNPGRILDHYKEWSVDMTDKFATCMTTLATDLGEAVDRYTRSEHAAVDAIWNAAGEEVPTDFKEQIGGPINYVPQEGPELDLKNTDPEKAHANVIRSLHDIVDDLGWALDIVDFILDALPGDAGSSQDFFNDLIDAFPDWGEYRRLGQAHGELDKSYLVIKDDFGKCMDILGGWWDGDAARAFEYHLREHWLVALETMSDVHDGVAHALRAGAATLDALASLCNFYIASWRKVFIGLINSVKELDFDVAGAIKLVQDIIEAIDGYFKSLFQIVEEIGTAVSESILAICNMFEADLALITGGLDGIDHD